LFEKLGSKKLSERTDTLVESLFFKYEPIKKEAGEETTALSENIVDSNALADRNLKIFGDEKRKLVFDDENSLAMKSLADGEVDFADPRVKIKSSSIEHSQIGDKTQNIMEVDLGEMTSLNEN